ncbi:hypothetical protein BJY01DRAFT_201479 [Aspergillus pseudoustus]|uniref:P-loop containing nucleoside triphosphate hydrolase protein n=1 Tax=Aspergillus pseudoustus TaxID=1810923 RepID=A0ABR4L190_9EURO
MGRTSIIALSGPSSSGKTTLARLLQRIFAHLDTNSDGTQAQAQAPPISTFIIHEDDFYHPDDRIPYTTTKSGDRIQDWDCVEAIDTNFLSASLRYVHENGHLPPRLKSKEDLNDVSPDSGVEDALIEELKGVVRDRLDGLDLAAALDAEGGEGKWTLAILEGFLLFAPPMASDDDRKHPLRPVHDQIDVHLFLPAPYDLVKERREKRSGYVTIGPAPTPVLPQRSSAAETGTEQTELDLEAEDDRPPQNFWTDPPGYVDDIVWPRYVRDHAWLLIAEDGGSRPEALDSTKDDELIRKVGQGVTLRTNAGVIVAPGQGSLPMAELLKWAVEKILSYLQESSCKAQ